MVLMALDHARFFTGRLHSAEFWGLPLLQRNAES
jgi:hypothetical protein